ncbi:MAG: transporter substrate-binding domain-containing protein [Prevotellaceae bacterium]|jgi:membrane-bound lytic murein transglycosylase MltF|nr:transporter substrate-binding domain-containing protein [Prevotellaceae bacterium]
MKKFKQKTILIIASAAVILIGVIIFAVSQNGLRDYQQIARKGVLRVATDYSSTDYFITGDTVAGFQYELINALCDSLHLRPEWRIENSLEQNIRDLEAGKIDIIARNIPVNLNLRERLLFSSSIIQIPQVLVQRKAEYNNGKQPIRNQLLLGGETVVVPQNSPNILRLRNLSNEIADTICVQEKPQYEEEQLMILVAKGDIDYTVSNRQTAQQNAPHLPELDIATAISFTQMQAWAMRPSSPVLKEKIDSFLINFLQTKDYRDIYRKYYK